MKTRGKASDQVTIGFCLYRNVLKCTENSVENMHKQSENGERQSLTVVCHSQTFCTQSIRTQLIRTQLEQRVFYSLDSTNLFYATIDIFSRPFTKVFRDISRLCSSLNVMIGTNRSTFRTRADINWVRIV